MADLSGRLTGFHKGIDSSVARRSREDAAVQLRKARVVERMNKRRAAAVRWLARRVSFAAVAAAGQAVPRARHAESCCRALRATRSAGREGGGGGDGRKGEERWPAHILSWRKRKLF